MVEDREVARRKASTRAFVGPLLMLLGGALAGVLLLRHLMLEPPSVAGPASATEQLSRGDHLALERLLHGSTAH